MAKSTKGGLGRGLDALLDSYEDTVKPAPSPAPAARPAQIPAPSQRRLKEEEVLEREEINETFSLPASVEGGRSARARGD